MIRKQKQLFKTRIVPGKKGSGKLFEEEFVVDDGPVECLGMTFENDEKRREYFLEKLREKLKDPEFRKIEGFPIGEDEDILALSDPPYYTACPNPFIEDFIAHYGKPYDPATDDYRREPFATDVSEGKNDPIYNLHSYHTKVPYKAIMKYILHFTEPGDLVFDGFGGTGMTGIAAQCCNNEEIVRKCGFGNIGDRRAVISELSTIGGFISGSLNAPLPDNKEIDDLENTVLSLEREYGWVYETHQTPGHLVGRIEYVVWSEVYLCANCGEEVSFYNNVLEKDGTSLGNNVQCPVCKSVTHKRTLERCFFVSFDPNIKTITKQVKFVPVLINYRIGSKRYQKIPDEQDIALIQKLNTKEIDCWFPFNQIPQIERYFKDGLHIINVTHTHQFYTRRNLLIAALLWSKLDRNIQRLLFTSFCDRHIVKRNRWLPTGPTRPLNNTLYFPPLFAEVNVFNIAKRKIRDMRRAVPLLRKRTSGVATTTQSSTGVPQIASNSIDYIFTDPPFGWNIIYSELNFLWESWLKVRTNESEEVIVNNKARKTIDDYRELISRCFSENFRILKPGRWMTVEFHNSSNIVWNSIQEALVRAGFVVADIRTLDKKQGSMNQDFYKTGAVKQDLIISAYKPNGGLEERFKLTAGTEDGVWDFVRTHLKQLPVFVSKNGQAE
ncbi:MAG: DNA methylase, partial [Desulfobacteraceae bacterium]|nr:DNA methylase [Desulfobacteraceae bacterium]